MSGLLIDEDLPRSLASTLRDAGFPTEDVRDIGFGGRPDDEIVAYARSHHRILVTRDVALANVHRLRSTARFGIVLIRFPQAIRARALSIAVVAAFRRMTPESLLGGVTVLEPGRARTRRLRDSG